MQTVESGKHADETYGEVLSKKPRYSDYPTTRQKPSGIAMEPRGPSSGPIVSRAKMREEVGIVPILDNSREGSGSGNFRGMRSVGISSELVLRLRYAMGNVFIFKPTSVRFGDQGFLDVGELNSPDIRRENGRLRLKTQLLPRKALRL